jgi:hypothetical protein
MYMSESSGTFPLLWLFFSFESPSKKLNSIRRTPCTGTYKDRYVQRELLNTVAHRGDSGATNPGIFVWSTWNKQLEYWRRKNGQVQKAGHSNRPGLCRKSYSHHPAKQSQNLRGTYTVSDRLSRYSEYVDGRRRLRIISIHATTLCHYDQHFWCSAGARPLQTHRDTGIAR